MSEIEERNAASETEAIGIRAADWMLARRLAENWSNDDQAALDAWLAESPAHLLAFWRLDAAWGRADRLKALRPSTQGQSEAAPRAWRVSPVRIIGGLAVVAIAGVAGLVEFRNPPAKTYATPIGGHLSVAFNNGLNVDLNTDTVLKVSDGADRRAATLEKGEAYFQIKHDAAHPFVLSLGSHRLTDLGTKFLVRNDENRVQVSLIEGRARFESTNASQNQVTDLAPGDVVVATADSMSVLKKSSQDLTNQLSWRSGVLVFDNATLADAAEELNRYNREKIAIPDPSVARLTIGGTFPKNDVLALTNAAQQVFGLNVVRRGDKIVISR